MVERSTQTAAIALITVGLAVSLAAQAQPPGSITGRVTDRATQQPIVDAQVLIVCTTRGTRTNDAGQYRLGSIAEGQMAIKFSTIAIFFILIDIELLFIWPWAMLYRRLGWFGLAEMLVFLGILMLGFLYIWKKGGLEWE